MKKQFLFGMAAVAALCSCSNNEVMEAPESLQTPITFGTYVGNSVNGRATIMDKAQLASDEFGVFAYYTAGNTYPSTNTTYSPNFMYNEKVTGSSTDSGVTYDWTYSPIKYWPNNNGDKVSFFAYAPYVAATNASTGTTANTYNVTSLSTNTEKSDPKVVYKVTPTVKDQKDLVYAQVIDRSKQNTVDNATISTTDKVEFEFKHALSRIAFSVTPLWDELSNKDNGSDGEAPATNIATDTYTTITVSSIKLKGKFYTQGTLNLSTTLAESAEPWSGQTGQDNETIFELTSANSNLTAAVMTDGFKTKTQANAVDSYIMVIPQASVTDMTVEIKYKVTTTDDKLEGGKSEIINTITSSSFSHKFEQSKAYMFNLYLGMTSVKVDASVSAWDPVSDDINVNVPTNKTNN